MNKIQIVPAATLYCIICATTSAGAQTPAVPKPTTLPARKSPQPVPMATTSTPLAPINATDKIVQRFLAITAAYKKIHSGDLRLSQTRMGRTYDATLAWRLPNRARLTLTSASGSQPAASPNAAPLAETVCDGTFLHEFSLSTPRSSAAASGTIPSVRYRKRPSGLVLEGTQTPPLVMALHRNEPLLGGETLLLLLAGENPLTHWAETGRLASVAPGETGLINGLPVERVVVVLRNEGITGETAETAAVAGEKSTLLVAPPPVSPAPTAPPFHPYANLPKPVPTTAMTRATAARVSAQQAAQTAARLRQGVRPTAPTSSPAASASRAAPQMRDDVVILTLAFGQDDHLLRQASETRAVWQEGRQVSVTSETTFSQIKVNPVLPDALFVFTPPPGVVLPAETADFRATPRTKGGKPSAAPLREAVPSARPVPPPDAAPSVLPVLMPPQSVNPSPTPTSATRVEIRGGAKHNNESPVQVSYPAGNISLLEKSGVSHTFLVRNAGSVPLVLGTLHPSCSCTHAAFPPAASANGTVTLAPGQETTVEVTVNLDGLPPGPLRKMVSVYPATSTTPTDPTEATAAAAPVAILTVEGTIAPAVTVTPPLINFGPVPSEQPKTLLVTADIDARLLPKGERDGAGDVQLTAEDTTLITVSPVSPVPVSQSVGDTAMPAPLSGTVRRQFRVAVNAHAPLGSLMTRLRFVPPAGTSAGQSVAWRSGTVPVVGLILGDVSAEPTQINFGSVEGDATQKVALSGISPQALVGLECTTSSPYFQVQVQEPTSSRAAARRVLVVRLLSLAPAGAVSAQVTVRLKNGQHLTLPVSGFVVQKVSSSVSETLAPVPNHP